MIIRHPQGSIDIFPLLAFWIRRFINFYITRAFFCFWFWSILLFWKWFFFLACFPPQKHLSHWYYINILERKNVLLSTFWKEKMSIYQHFRKPYILKRGVSMVLDAFHSDLTKYHVKLFSQQHCSFHKAFSMCIKCED